ncbi:MAG: ABC transporter ATP-binding protein [Clostridia bacterium]|nr:ABC transporter ATP-binding protein [Clostridia bacterium]
MGQITPVNQINKSFKIAERRIAVNRSVPAIELKNVTKRFGEVVANKNVNLSVNRGEILSLLGENGSGKTTLMNMISGIYYPDEGDIFIDGKLVNISSPKDAFEHGIGMIHQHFKLVDVFTAAQNIVLGVDDGKKFSIKKVNSRVKEIADKYGFEIDVKKKIYDMSVSEKQTIEIIKVLYRGADILILDEPTAVLTPQETVKLFAILKKMKEDGKSVIIITHKLNEVMEISDRVAILRKGEYIGTVNTAETNEKELTEMMVGKKVDLQIQRLKTDFDKPLLEIRDLSVKGDDGSVKIKDVSFYIRGGEILGVAGVAGCGQKELCEAVAGLRKIDSGLVMHKGESLIGLTPKQIIEKGVSMSFIPEDRLGMGLAPNFSITDNMMLKSYNDGKGPFVDRKTARKNAAALIKKLEIVTPSTETPIRRLSGGNVQKVLVGREIEAGPNVIVTAYPVRGLDINSSYVIYDILNEQKQKGTGILFIGEDLDVMLALCDKIMVLCHGKNMGIVHASKVTKEDIGLMMTGSKNLTEEKVYGKAKDSHLSEQEWEEKKTNTKEAED